MDEKFMDIAIEISKKAEFPYGAIIAKDGEIIGRSDDDTIISKTIYTHAELMAIESACKKHANLYGELMGATLYTTCEPCMMCMGAILYAGITRIVYASTLEDSNQYVEKEMLCDIGQLAQYVDYDIEIVRGYKREQALEIMKKYQSKKWDLRGNEE